jgi:hypothetical protein
MKITPWRKSPVQAGITRHVLGLEGRAAKPLLVARPTMEGDGGALAGSLSDNYGAQFLHLFCQAVEYVRLPFGYDE